MFCSIQLRQAGREAAPPSQPVFFLLLHVPSSIIVLEKAEFGGFSVTVFCRWRLTDAGSWQCPYSPCMPYTFHVVSITHLLLLAPYHFSRSMPCPSLPCQLLAFAGPIVQHTIPSACACTLSVLCCPLGCIHDLSVIIPRDSALYTLLWPLYLSFPRQYLFANVATLQ